MQISYVLSMRKRLVVVTAVYSNSLLGLTGDTVFYNGVIMVFVNDIIVVICTITSWRIHVNVDFSRQSWEDVQRRVNDLGESESCQTR